MVALLLPDAASTTAGQSAVTKPRSRNDLLGFYSYRGISRATAGSFSHISSYGTQVRGLRSSPPDRAAVVSPHQDPDAERDLGPLPFIRYAVDANGVVTDAGISYNAYPSGSHYRSG